MNILLYIIEFSLFVILQSMCINGIHECFRGSCVNDVNKGKVCNGNIFYKISPSFFEKNKEKSWTLPLWGCVKCESSVIGGIIYWSAVTTLFGFKTIEIPIWVADAFILIPLNWFIYKKM